MSLQLKRSKRAKNPTGEMSLVEHLQELRRRVMVSLAAVALGTIVGFIWYQSSPPGIIPLGEIIRGPYCNLPDELRADFSGDGHCRLLATSPFEMFMLRLKVGALAGLVLASPVWLTQIWNFITPGLHKNERRYTFTFVTIAVFLFVAGAVLAYFVLDKGLFVLMSIGTEFQVAALTGGEYYNFLLALIVIFGVSFEVPLITVLLNLAHVVTYQQLKDKRRFIWAFLFLFAAFVTPGQDPISMVILAIALCAMMEIATQIARLNDKRRKKNQADWLEVEDDETTDIAAPEPIGPVTATPAPQSTSAARPIDSPKRQDPKAQDFTRSDFDDIL